MREPVLVSLAEVQPQQVRWLWRHRVPYGKLTIFAGDPGLGKSLVALYVAAEMSRLGGHVVILSAEDDPADTIRPRLEAAGADLSRVHLLQAVRETTIDGKQAERAVRLDRDIAQVAAAIRQYPMTKLVIIDPLSAYMGNGDSRSDEQVRNILAPLADLARKTRVAIICIKHLNKDEKKSAMYRAGGSIAFVAAARVAWMFVKDTQDPERRLMLLLKCNIGADLGGEAYRIKETESGQVRVELEPEPVHIALEDVLRPSANYANYGGSALSAAMEWLEHMLSNGSMAVTDVEAAAKKDGIGWMTVRRAADNLGVVKKREGFGAQGRWAWSLP